MTLINDRRSTTDFGAIDAAALHAMLEAEDSEAAHVAAAAQAMVPSPIELDGYAIAGTSVADGEAGGDVLDWAAVDRGAVFSVADVMGKGLPAAVLGANLRGALRARSCMAPADAVSALEQQIERDLRAADSFATAFHGRLDAASGRVDYVDAGHGIAVHVAADGSQRLLRSRELPIGLFPGGPRTAEHIVLEPGDALIVGSDGLLELHDGSLVALDLVAAWFREAPDLPTFIDTLAVSARGAHPGDDVTVLAVVRH